jgi:hypothetical protein
MKFPRILPDIRLIKTAADLERTTDFGLQDIAVVQLLAISMLVVTVGFVFEGLWNVLHNLLKVYLKTLAGALPAEPISPASVVLALCLLIVVGALSIVLGFKYHWRHKS